MTRDKLDKANELICQIDDLSSAIESIEKEEVINGRPVLNWNFDYVDDKEAFKNNSLKFLKARLSKYQKEFDKL